MKNLNLSVMFLIALISMQPLYTQAQSNQQSLLAFLYTNILQKPQASILPHAQDSTKKVIIFDLNGVICTTNKLQVAQIIGFDVISAYLLEHFTWPSSKDLFTVLEKIPAVSTQPVFYNDAQLPGILADFKTNMQDLRDIQDAMVNHIASSSLTTAEKNMYTQTVMMMTTPKKLVATKRIILEGLQLIRNLKKLGYKIYILSNWDAASFPLFMQSFPELFTYEDQDLFDGIMISGQQHTAKPSTEIYEQCLHKFNIDASQAIFIDDALKNVQTAQKLGISSIHCKNKNINKVIKELKNMLSNNPYVAVINKTL